MEVLMRARKWLNDRYSAPQDPLEQRERAPRSVPLSSGSQKQWRWATCNGRCAEGKVVSVNEMFPEKCFWGSGRCRNKVRVWIPISTRISPKAPPKEEMLPSCVKHADAFQRQVLTEHASLVWATTRQEGHPDT